MYNIDLEFKISRDAMGVAKISRKNVCYSYSNITYNIDRKLKIGRGAESEFRKDQSKFREKHFGQIWVFIMLQFLDDFEAPVMLPFLKKFVHPPNRSP